MSHKPTEKPFKFPGAKSYLAPWILEHFPPRSEYINLVEPYAGSAAVTFAHDPTDKAEILNDLDSSITNFFQVLQHPKLYKELERRLSVTPFSKAEYARAKELVQSSDTVEKAHGFFVLVRQSMSGSRTGFAPITNGRLRRGMNEQVSAWLSAVQNLPEVVRRIQRAVILNDKAAEVVKSWDRPNTVIYCDPPYVQSTRSSQKLYGVYEMTEQDHRDFLSVCLQVKKAYVLISGYRCKLYDEALKTWNRYDVEIDNKASKKVEKPKMVESLWTNF